MSFSKAAEEMHVAQSAVSQQIRAMEEELGFALFERSTRRVSFTDAGQSFYVDCVKLMAGLDEALARAASKLNGKKNFLTVGIAYAAGSSVLDTRSTSQSGIGKCVSFRRDLCSHKFSPKLSKRQVYCFFIVHYINLEF